MTWRQYGFTLDGIKPGWEPDLMRLAHDIDAISVAWGDPDHTSLYVTAHKPQASMHVLCTMLNTAGLTDWRQQVQFIPLDDMLTAVVFSHDLPGGSVRSLIEYPGIAEAWMNGRTIILIRDMQKEFKDWLDGQHRVWQEICQRDVPIEPTQDVPFFWLDAAGVDGQVIELDNTLLAVRSYKPIQLPEQALKNRGINIAIKGTRAVVLGAGTRPEPAAEMPHRTVVPTPMEFAVGLTRTLGGLERFGATNNAVHIRV